MPLRVPERLRRDGVRYACPVPWPRDLERIRLGFRDSAERREGRTDAALILSTATEWSGGPGRVEIEKRSTKNSPG
jgi:hypothetical protein